MTEAITTSMIVTDAITTGIEINDLWRGGTLPHRQIFFRPVAWLVPRAAVS
jgi:hypothetical protein